MKEFHGIVINKSLKDESVINDWNIIGQEKVGSWIIYKVSVDEKGFKKFINKLQLNTLGGPWYSHFYDKEGDKLIIVFKERVFNVNKNKSSWTDIIRYGQKLNIPKEQLDFVPNRFQDEKY